MRYNRIFLCFLGLLLLFSGCQRANAAEDTAKPDFMEEVVFLGDSITAHMTQRANIPKERVWASKARYLNLDSRITYAKIVAPDTGEEELIAEVAARLRPRYLVITLGIDYGVYYYRDQPQTFALYYGKLLDALAAASPDTLLIPQSILPVSADCTVVSNEMIDRANREIRKLAAARSLLYLDTQSVMRDESGFLPAAYCSSADGIHLSEQGYAAMLVYIRGRAVEMGWST